MSKSVLGICFSEVRNGNCAILLNELLKPAKAGGFEVEQVNIGQFKIRQCIGCFKCNNPAFSCVLKDDLDEIITLIESADALAITAPCYCIGAPSQMKALLDRTAAKALDRIENGTPRRPGVALSVAGASDTWYSLQRALPSLLMKLYNCDVIEQKTYGSIALKGDILNHPDVLLDANRIGERLLSALEGSSLHDSSVRFEAGNLICPHCKGDLFQIQSEGLFICGVCGVGLQKKGLIRPHFEVIRDGKFTPDGARDHSQYIGGNILKAMDSSEETTRRMKLYEADGTIIQETPAPTAALDCGDITWDQEAEDTFTTTVPKAFQRFVRTAIEKKVAARGQTIITKEVFLDIKKESGN